MVGLAFGALVAVFLVKWAPEWLTNDDLTGKDRAEDEGRNRTAVLASVAGVLAAIGAYYTHRTFLLNRQTYEHTRDTAARSHELDRAGQITERFTRAIDQLGATDQLGKPKIDVVLGGIYALERIAKDSEDDHPQVVEVLTAYVREHARYKPAEPPTPTTASEDDESESPNDDEGPTLATDVQAAMDVLARRDITQDRENHSLNLAATDLRGLVLDAGEGGHLEMANLVGAHLERARLENAHLEGANLENACLEGANLREARLEGANLREARLERAELADAHLEDANLRKARLERAWCLSTHFERADLAGAHLEGAALGYAHLERAGLENTHFEGAGLGGANFEGANLTWAHLDGALYGDDTYWPTPEFDPKAKGARRGDEGDEDRSAETA